MRLFLTSERVPGRSVRDLLEVGYRNVLGIDLFVPEDV